MHVEPFAVEPVENRLPQLTCRALLRKGGLEYGHSVATVNAGGFYCPNRDYAYEGLACRTQSGCWKFLDAIAFALKRGGSPLELKPATVFLAPDSAVHEYETPAGKTRASYSLSSNQLIFSLEFPKAAVAELKLFIDIRFMYDSSPPAGDYVFYASGSKAFFSRAGKNLEASFFPLPVFLAVPSQQHWFYKLGAGERSLDGAPRGEERVLFSPGVFSFAGGKLKVVFSPPAPEAKALSVSSFLKRMAGNSAKVFGGEYNRGLLARAECLARFSGTGLPLPEAGAFWFRTPWLSDAFFSLSKNAEFYSLAMTAAARKALSYGNSIAGSGLLPTKLDERSLQPVGESLASTLYFLDACSKLKAVAAKEFAAGRDYLGRLCDTLSQNSGVELRGGLLWSPPNYSWTDAVVGGVSTRLPPAWRSSCEGEKFLLVEANALWIRLLHDYGHPLAKQALLSFHEVFGKPPFPHIARLGKQLDSTASSHALSAAVSLAPFLNFSELRTAFNASKQLWVHRKGKLFGLLTLAGGRTYFSDEDYHSAVAWPRETLHLIDALELLGQRQLLKQVLESNLEHQQEEGTVFYNQELFAVDENNEPLGVKNPGQMWSQWVDPYLRFLKALPPKSEQVVGETV